MKPTPARRRALAAMLDVHPELARESNVTGVHRGNAFVYWQSARWLVEQGLAEQGLADQLYPGLGLTDAGLALAQELQEAGR